MCGIAGIVFRDWDNGLAQATVRRMIFVQRHRGPDGQGFYDGEGATLGHARLAIIDLSETGIQPMSDPSGRYWITYNGEIYNYIELMAELSSHGYVFRSHSDTEVIIYAYLQWGAECVQRLRGMFAFAIWDEKDKSLFAARDRLGIKPFHYWTDNNRLAFSSEIKSLLEFIPERRMHVDLARQYLAWNLLDHEPAQTMLADIYRLPAGHTLTWQANHPLSICSYWHLEADDRAETPVAHRQNLIDQFRQRFEECIAIHLRSDVPVGTCLSGGLDSSAVVCVSNHLIQGRGEWHPGWQHTFSACFEDRALDERSYIQAVVAATGVEPHYVFPSGENLLGDLEQWIWHQEEPVAGTNEYAQYCVARMAREHNIKVLLDGQGADEQLAGYRKFIFVYLRQLLFTRRYAKAAQEAAAFLLNPDILRTSRIVDGRRYFFKSAGRADTLWPELISPEKPAGMGINMSLHQRLLLDMTTFSLPVLLRYEDRNSMAFGVEARVPFVDHVLVEWLSKLPADMLLSNGWTKYIMRQSLGDLLPPLVRQRKTKLGFLTPEANWLTGPVKPWVLETLNAPYYLGEIADIEKIRKLRSDFERGEHSPDLLSLLFRLTCYETWARLFIKI